MSCPGKQQLHFHRVRNALPWFEEFHARFSVFPCRVIGLGVVGLGFEEVRVSERRVNLYGGDFRLYGFDPDTVLRGGVDDPGNHGASVVFLQVEEAIVDGQFFERCAGGGGEIT